MKHIKINKHSVIAIISLGVVFSAVAQEKLKEQFVVAKDVVIQLNTSHTNVIFESWNKDVVGVEAYVEGAGLSREQLNNVLHTWEVSANAADNNVRITANTSKGSTISPSAVTVNMQGSMRDIQVLGPMLSGMLAPLLHKIAQNPIPSELAHDMKALQFDYVAYGKDGQRYMDSWEKDMEAKLGSKFEVAIEEWGKQLEKDAKKWSESMEVQMEAWGRQFERDMQRLGQHLEKQTHQMTPSRPVAIGGNPANTGRYIYEVATPVKVNKVLKVFIPKTAQLQLHVRHGEVALADQVNNIKASLSHTKFAANIIAGGTTRIKASYSPIFVKQWNDGVLVIDYVKNCRIENAKAIRLKANSSNVYIQNLNAAGLITGNFGNITIANMDTDFSSLDLNLQNTDLRVNLPKSAFNFTYLGSRNLMQLPKAMELRTMRNFGNESITGFFKSRNTHSAITINAKYSDIALQ